MAKDQSEGVSIPVFSIEDVVLEFNLSSFTVKIDCEGCEYSVISSISKPTFGKIKEIFIEYHDMPKEIPKILMDEGFTVTTNVKKSKIGIIYGKKL